MWIRDLNTRTPQSRAGIYILAVPPPLHFFYLRREEFKGKNEGKGKREEKKVIVVVKGENILVLFLV